MGITGSIEVISPECDLLVFQRAQGKSCVWRQIGGDTVEVDFDEAVKATNWVHSAAVTNAEMFAVVSHNWTILAADRSILCIMLDRDIPDEEVRTLSSICLHIRDFGKSIGAHLHAEDIAFFADLADKKALRLVPGAMVYAQGFCVIGEPSFSKRWVNVLSDLWDEAKVSIDCVVEKF